jgi:hypothetical protein
MRIHVRVLVGYVANRPTGFSTDEGTPICMGVSAGARGSSRNGPNIHVHTGFHGLPHTASRLEKRIGKEDDQVAYALNLPANREQPSAERVPKPSVNPVNIRSLGLLGELRREMELSGVVVYDRLCTFLKIGTIKLRGIFGTIKLPRTSSNASG